MGICDSNKNQNQNQNKLINNTESDTFNNQNINKVIQPNNQNITSKLNENISSTKIEQNIDSNTKFIINNKNTINEIEQGEINKQVSKFLEENDKPSNIDRHCSMGSSLKNEDSIGYNQTRNTFAN